MSITPYDTGAVLEPHTWVTSTAGLTSTNEGEFGKVDFDSDESATICTIQIVRNDHREECNACLGEGEYGYEIGPDDYTATCPSCHGTGRATARYTIKISGSRSDFEIEWEE